MNKVWWKGRSGQAIAAVLGLAVLGFAFAQQDTMPRREVTLLAQGVRLSATDPAVEHVGALKFMGGLWLQSEDKGFGGLSGFVVSETQGALRLIGVTDQGEKLTARLLLENSRLIGLDQGVLQPLLDEQGAPIAGKSLGDAESVTRLPDGRILIGFERRHRIWAYGPNLTGSASVFATPETLGRAPSNGGLEAMASFPDGRVLAITERLAAGDGNIAGFLWSGNAWSSLSWKPSAEGFAPVDATVAPNGDLLVLERYFTAMTPGRLSSRVLRVAAETVKPGAVLRGEVLAELTSPLISENFECITSIRSAGGAIQIGIASDNNFNSFQRTLLLWFEVPKGA
jgi:hypothetical protein